MAADRSVIHPQGRPAVVALPAEIDISGSRELCGQLGRALASASTVIVDMTETRFCDSSGIRILLLAQEQAAATGVELRLVIPSASVLRALALVGADWLLPVFPSLDEAMGRAPAPGAARYVPGKGVAG